MTDMALHALAREEELTGAGIARVVGAAIVDELNANKHRAPGYILARDTFQDDASCVWSNTLFGILEYVLANASLSKMLWRYCSATKASVGTSLTVCDGCTLALRATVLAFRRSQRQQLLLTTHLLHWRGPSGSSATSCGRTA
mmetsp:Transcript_22628/g.59137  ORF Transcript_22628/g.59137 Transcript_22628/m.59137 type:complete len:143 (-) Transcript_22628:1405-1833(-)